MLTLCAVRADGFALVPMPDIPTPTVKFTGNGDTEAIAPLDRFLKQLHENLIRDHSAEVDVDLNELYFMNSSCVKTLMSWIHKVKMQGAPYRVCLTTNPRQPWQRRSLEPMQRLAPDVVVLRQVQPDP